MKYVNGTRKYNHIKTRYVHIGRGSEKYGSRYDEIFMDIAITELDLCRDYDMEDVPTKGIGKLINLEILDLHGQGILVPEALGNLVKLKKLWLSGCYNINWPGYIPKEIGNLINLKFLAINDNDLEPNDIPEELSKLVNLEELYCGMNCWRTLPIPICNLINLKKLDISNSPMLQKLPREIGRLRSLEILDITDTDIRRLPLSLAKLTNLKEIHTDYDVIIPEKVKAALPNCRYCGKYDRMKSIFT